MMKTEAKSGSNGSDRDEKRRVRQFTITVDAKKTAIDMGTFTTFAYFDLIGRITLEKCQQRI